MDTLAKQLKDFWETTPVGQNNQYADGHLGEILGYKNTQTPAIQQGFAHNLNMK
jgi:hypothetical protein